MSDVDEFMERAHKVRGERVNETGRMCVDRAIEIMERLRDEPDSKAAASLSKSAEGWIRAAIQADKSQESQDIVRLREYQDEKRKRGNAVRTIH